MSSVRDCCRLGNEEISLWWFGIKALRSSVRKGGAELSEAPGFGVHDSMIQM